MLKIPGKISLLLVFGFLIALGGENSYAGEMGSIDLCSQLSNRELYKDKENEDFAMMVAGKDGWLFRSHFDLKFRFKLTERTLDSFRRLSDAFRSKGTELAIVMMPTRGLVHYNELTPAELETFDYKAAKRSYFKMLDELRSTGIAVADMTDVDKIDSYFLKRDNHWTYKGAQFTANSTANAIKKLPVYKDLKKIDYTNKEIMKPLEATHRYAEFINKVCGTNIPRETLTRTFETIAKNDNDSEENLFGDSGRPEVTLLGTSNSTNPQPSFANFEGFLKEYLHTDILNEAVSGGSLQGSIGNYVLNGNYEKTKPKVIIWEMSAHYGFNQQAFLREIVPSVYGDCSTKDAVASGFIDITDNEEPILLENLADKNIKTNKYYVAITLSDKDLRTVKVKFTHTDGRTDTVKLERSIRSFPTNPGTYYVELSDVMEAPLDKVSLEVKKPFGTAETHICHVPPINETPVTSHENVNPDKKLIDKQATQNNSLFDPVKNFFRNISWFSPYKVKINKKTDFALKREPVLPDLTVYTQESILAKVPALQKGVVKIENMEGAAPLRKFAFDKRLVEFQNIQDRVEPKAIHIYSGVYDIESLMQEVAGTDTIVKKDNGYLIRLPIALYPGAKLVLKDLDRPVLLSQPRGAFITSAGDVFVINSKIIGWNEKDNRPAELNKDLKNFRPFITMWDGSHIYVTGSQFQNLGYSLSKSYGFTISTNDVIQEVFEEEYGDLPPPSGWILNSEFDHMYFGFYSYEAKNVAVIGNTYKDNVVYGIDPHDRSEKLIIAYNDVSGSKKKHGIIISRDVKDSFIIHNNVHENKGSGIMLDRNSSNNIVAFNRSQYNEGDGITLYESPDNILYHNEMKNNEGSGVRVRNSWGVKVVGGNVSMNKDYAFQIYEDSLRHTNRDFEMDPVTERSVVAFDGVQLSSNGGILKTNNFESVRFENMDIDKNLLSRAPFAGDVQGKAETVISYARRKAPAIQIESSSAMKNMVGPES